MQFLDKDFLLETNTAKQLFHEYASKMPIIDYHCHLSPQEIAEDKSFASITEAWLGGDHYKWRAMRSYGIPELEITGEAEDRTKFKRWSETLPWCIGNPLYHWTHLELQRYFGITQALSLETEEKIWNECNKKIQSNEFSAKKLIQKSNVKVICTTDDPCDDLKWHKIIASDTNFETKVLPAFRPDKILQINNTNFKTYISTLAEVSKHRISNLDELKEAICRRIDYFHEQGCRLSDHALQYIPQKSNSEHRDSDKILKIVLDGERIEKEEKDTFQFDMLVFLAKEYETRNWTMQFHIGALRNVNPNMLKTIGPDTGFDVIGDWSNAEGLASLLGTMEANFGLPKTILYNLNPSDNFILASMIGAFQGSDKYTFGKMQFGSGWWYNDQKIGMIQQLSDLANLGILGKFIGMLTDSRSFLSYPRHEYFRRIFCNLLGTWIENGEYPNDETMLKQIVEGVSYKNAQEFFGWD